MPAWSPVNGRPLALAPCIPGASPTMTSRAAESPNGGTGLHQYDGWSAATASRNCASRGQRRQDGSYTAVGLTSGIIGAWKSGTGIRKSCFAVRTAYFPMQPSGPLSGLGDAFSFFTARPLLLPEF